MARKVGAEFDMFSLGNGKLCNKVAIFSMLRGRPECGGTCICATKLCSEGKACHYISKTTGKTHRHFYKCYADKAEKQYKEVYAMRARNTASAKAPDFPLKLNRQLDALMARGIKMVRIHEDGDFFSQDYLDTWTAAIAAHPDMQFLSYTKSFTLDWKTAKELTNWSIIWSLDYTTTLPVPDGGPTAYLLLPDEPAGTVKAPAYTCVHKSSKKYCGSECKICWNTRKNGKVQRIYFEAH